MDLFDIIEKRQGRILDKWQDRVLSTYSPDAYRLFKHKNDPFANPVGSTLKKGLEGLLDLLLGEGDVREKAVDLLEDSMKVRAVQDFSPSNAVGFLFELKGVIREQVGKDLPNLEERPDWSALDSKIDAMALAGFDVFMECRERLNRIRVNEVRNLSYKAMKRANLVCDLSEIPDDPDGETVN
ncbi:RsbT co-antagonist protein rsbRD N-terminal domain-containing protein [Desulfatibacillum alkenivorans DSM 16219]|uniref:RsbT co-antagonist protein rsbRD N-terminal domain-containing protein n=1 Tax=Desulfatibacillum alkenivorans DSM 16219 TaxID=1121393 RepID=A0A1M6PB23_9BACT|nr:RsbRD N-terminal domain-containing protein [Desulfatibacillum alkenivorans]SHK05169.1 RsbT co-antagonist protein rsbRD N-terminal domain-containing protein [Desulfatibacillum alkenivorans DSM 16219]